jgi:hypothetical protein
LKRLISKEILVSNVAATFADNLARKTNMISAVGIRPYTLVRSCTPDELKKVPPLIPTPKAADVALSKEIKLDISAAAKDAISKDPAAMIRRKEAEASLDKTLRLKNHRDTETQSL